MVEAHDDVDLVSEAATALEAARLANRADVLLMDCDLPDADIAAAITLVRRAAGGVAVIAVSAGADPDVVRTALDAGAMSFLSHTGPALTVGDAVSAALRGRGMLDPDVIRPSCASTASSSTTTAGAIGRRSRAWPRRSRPRTRSPAAICRRSA